MSQSKEPLTSRFAQVFGRRWPIHALGRPAAEKHPRHEIAGWKGGGPRTLWDFAAGSDFAVAHSVIGAVAFCQVGAA
jgi:hypothetical protein